MHTDTCRDMHTHTLTNMYTQTHTLTYSYTHTDSTGTHTHTHTYIHTYTYIHTHTDTHTHTYIHRHIHIHTHTRAVNADDFQTTLRLFTFCFLESTVGGSPADDASNGLQEKVQPGRTAGAGGRQQLWAHQTPRRRFLTAPHTHTQREASQHSTKNGNFSIICTVLLLLQCV